jgi:hypothetical protein
VSECQVQRTLVKSPPELWEALSDPAALARHLGEFGEIRITRLEPETTVEWEADHASGTVHIAPSGWGTKVTLTAIPAGAQEPVAEATTAMVVWTEPQPFPPPAAIKTAADPEPEEGAADPEAEAAVPEPAAIAAETPGPEPGPDPEPPAPEPGPEEPAAFETTTPVVAAAPPVVISPRRTWLQRLFGRGVTLEAPPVPAPAPIELPSDPAPEPEPDLPEDPPPAAEAPLATMEPDVATVEFSVASMWEAENATSRPDTSAEPEESLEPEAAVEPDPPAEPEQDEVPRIDGERATAVLTSVLDDLGAAHHRPFSR